MRLSQYVDAYLNKNGRYTIGTFLRYTLRGKAKEYSGGYERSLRRSMERLEQLGKVVRCRSVRSCLAWRRAEELER